MSDPDVKYSMACCSVSMVHLSLNLILRENSDLTMYILIDCKYLLFQDLDDKDLLNVDDFGNGPHAFTEESFRELAKSISIQESIPQIPEKPKTSRNNKDKNNIIFVGLVVPNTKRPKTAKKEVNFEFELDTDCISDILSVPESMEDDYIVKNTNDGRHQY